MKKAFIAITDSYRNVSYLEPGVRNRDFYFSYSHELPNIEEYNQVSYWMPGGYAAKLRRIGLGANLSAPGQNWLSSLDSSLTGRSIATTSLSEIPRDVELFVKITTWNRQYPILF